MVKALTLLDEYKRNELFDNNDELEENIIYLYMAIRLKPLLNHKSITTKVIDDIANYLADAYFDYEYSLDLMINAVYNFINQNKTYPSPNLLSDNIETFLQEYAT